MLKDFFVKVIDTSGKYLRTVTVSACDYEMALCMAFSVLKENEFVGGF